MPRYQKLSYVALNVTDIERAVRFYRDTVGLEYVGAGPQDCRFFRCGTEHHDVVLFPHEKPGLKRIGFQMENRRETESLFELLSGRGLTVAEVPKAECEAFHQSAGFRFAEPITGVTFEFFDAMREYSAPYRPTVTNIQRLGHIVVKTPRLEEAARFFSEVMNFGVSDVIDGLVVFMRCNPNPLHHSFALGSGEPGLHHVNFMVTDMDDIGRAYWRFQRDGIPVVHGPGRHPPSGSVFLYFLEPDAMTLEYSFGMEEFPEHGARQPRVLEPIQESFDYWGATRDKRKNAVGEIEPSALHPHG